ncbi:FAD-binding oxidoreductase [Pseudonocardia lacus]|uniref:FAD-binding oxidoreductase n=1 Tax=Pseudonocardia lacus TaxID=2835865 RepID=UPI0027E31214|nr:FAD-binding oxidoreductase [Pseudonocardia lacus]
MADLVRRYRAVPQGERVRLAKPTSNLFRFGAPPAARLDASALTGVVDVDPVARTADVQGMATYETIVDATLAHGLMPLVVPQLKTITLGGAVTGLGIESSSFRHGLPHESVLEIDVLTADGEVVTATPDGEHADLYAGFPNSYGTLGYALRLKVELQPVARYVRLEHRRVPTDELAATVAKVCDAGGDLDFVDGTVFGRDEQFLTLGTFTDDPAGQTPSDYTGQQIFYRSIRERPTDLLTARDYIWRWDTDWFWCSRAFGAQNALVRRLWPQRYRRSDVYRKLVALDQRTRFTSRLRRITGKPQEEMVIQDVEIPVDRLVEFLDAFHREIGISPVWLCPVRLRGERTWPLYPMTPGELYVNVGFWSAVPEVPGRPDAHNRRIERLVADLDGHKSLYSTVHYSADEFWQRYNGPAYRALKGRYDPRGRLGDLHTKVTG